MLVGGSATEQCSCFGEAKDALVFGEEGVVLYANASAVMGIAMEALTSVPTATPHLTYNGTMSVTQRCIVQKRRTGH